MTQQGSLNQLTPSTAVTSATGIAPILVDGSSGIATSGDITISVDGTVPITFTADSGSTTSFLNELKIFGTGGATTSASGGIVTIDATGAVGVSSLTGTAPILANGLSGSPQLGPVTVSVDGTVPINFTLDTGTAIASGNELKIFGAGGVTVSGTGSVITIDGSAAIGVTDITATAPLTANGLSGSAQSGSVTLAANNATTSTVGVASFNSTNFSVTAGAVSSNNFTINTTAPLSGGGSITLGGTLTLSLSGSGYVASISGTANQINASASTGAVTLSLSSTIVTPGTLAVNGALQGSSTTTSNATGPYNLAINGTQTTSTGSTFAQAAIIIQSVFNATNNLFTSGGITNICRFNIPLGRTQLLAAAYYASINSSGNLGTITKLAHFYSDGFVAIGGTATNVYGFYGADPATGSASVAAYFANLSVGYSTVGLSGTNNAIFSGNVSIGSSSLTSQFNVGSANQFQIDSSGVVTSGTWHGSVVELAYGGTNANLTASIGGIFYSTASAGAILSGTATANQVLLSGASAAPAWSTATYPATTTINQILYSSANNVIGGVTASNNGVLISGTTGIPSWLAAGTTGQVLIATTSNPASWGTLSSLAVTSISGTSNQINVSASTGAVTLSLSSTIVTPGTLAINSLTTGSVLFSGASSIVSQSNTRFFWDNTNNRLGIGVNSFTIDSNTDTGLQVTSVSASKTAQITSSNTTQTNGFISLWSGRSGDTNSAYIWSAGTAMRFGTATDSSTSGFSEKARFTSGGNFGIGVTPVSKLDVSGGVSVGSFAGSNAAPSNGLIVSGQVGIAIASVDSVSSVTTTNAGFRRVFYVGGTSTVTSSFDTYGSYCSFATWSPSAGNTNYIVDFSGTGRFVAPSASTLSGILGCFYASPTVSGNIGTISQIYGFVYDGGSATGGTVTNAYGAYFATPTHGTNKHALHAHNASIGSSYVTSSVPPTDGMIIQGNVGIGTTGPLNKLDVSGALAGGTYAGSATAPANTCMFSGGFIAGNGTAGGPTYTFFSDNTAGMYYTTNTLNFSTSSTRRVFIDSSGLTIPSPGLLITNTGTSVGGLIHWALQTTGGSLRCAIGLQDTETGSGNAGSNFNIYTYKDDTSFNKNPMTIIRSSGATGFNTGSTSISASSQVHILSTNAYGLYTNGTQTAVDGSVNSASIYVNPTMQPTNGSTISAGIYDVPVLISPSGKTITVAAGQYINCDTGSNVGVISSLIPLYIGLGNLTVNGTITNAYGIYVSQPLASATGNYYAASIQGGQVWFRRGTATDTTITTKDYIIGVTSTAAARTITLPSTAPDSGWVCIVKDESNAASVNNITIARNGRTINGAAANLTINTNSGVFRIYSDGSNYWTW